MINFRFHLVSVVAVFLALGVGVAMGASFIDRATVETLRNRVDDLEDGYRERGTEIDDLRDHLRATDEATATLLDESSGLLADRLAGTNVVLVAPAEMDAEPIDAAWTTLQSADAVRAGTIRLDPTLELDDDGALERARRLVGLGSANPSLVRARLSGRLADSFAVLTAAPAAENGPPDTEDGPEPGTEPGADVENGDVENGATAPPTTTPPTTTPFRPDGPDPDAEEVAAARAFIRDAADAGFITIGTASVEGDAAFPDVDRVSYVMLVADGATEGAVTTVHRLAAELADAAPATVTVAETAAPRSPGELPGVDGERVGSMLVGLRSDDEAFERLSTVDHLDEVVGRAALVLAIQEQLDGDVGHYGTGVGATRLVPALDGG